jgi:hypothetical protein
MGWSSPDSSPSSSAHRRRFMCHPEERPGKNGVTAGEREELGVADCIMAGAEGPDLGSATLASALARWVATTASCGPGGGGVQGSLDLVPSHFLLDGHGGAVHHRRRRGWVAPVVEVTSRARRGVIDGRGMGPTGGRGDGTSSP